MQIETTCDDKNMKMFVSVSIRVFLNFIINFLVILNCFDIQYKK